MGAPWSKKPEPGEQERPHWFRVDLSPVMRDEMLKIIARGPRTGTTIALTEALELAERIDTPYTPPVDWTRLEKWAMNGYGLVDQIQDGREPKGEPAPRPQIDPPGGMGT